MAAALRRGLLLLIFWPAIVSLRVLLLGEHLAAKVLGTYLGLLQASPAASHLMLSLGAGMVSLLRPAPLCFTSVPCSQMRIPLHSPQSGPNPSAVRRASHGPRLPSSTCC